MTPEQTREVCDYCFSAFPLVVKPKKTYELWHDNLGRYDFELTMRSARELMTRNLTAPPHPGAVREIVNKHLTVVARAYTPEVSPPHSKDPSEVCAQTWACKPDAARILKKNFHSSDGGGE